MRYMIPIDLINTISVTECFVKYIFKLYRLSNLIISITYRGVSFGSITTQVNTRLGLPPSNIAYKPRT